MIDSDYLKQKRALVEAATPGPWSAWTSNSFRRITSDAGSMHRDGGVLHGSVHRDGQTDLDGNNRDRDLAFIVDARTTVPELLDEVERLQAENEWLISRDLAAMRDLDVVIKARDGACNLADAWITYFSGASRIMDPRVAYLKLAELRKAGTP